MDKELIKAEAIARLSLNTAASPIYAKNFVTNLVEEIERFHVKLLTGQELKVLKPTRLIPFHRDVLQHLFEDNRVEIGSSFHNMAINLQADKNRVRLACRALKRKGLAKQVSFHDDDGYIRGSGYAITPAGIAYGEKQGWKGGDA